MIIELEINGARVIISGDNLTVNVTQDETARADVVAQRVIADVMPSPAEIKSLRERLSLTQSGLGQLLNVTQATVCRWEIGTDEPNGQAAIKLSRLVADTLLQTEASGIAALRDWIRAVRGRSGRLAESLGLTHGAIPQWREVPADKLIAVESITGIKRQILRPDLFEGMPA